MTIKNNQPCAIFIAWDVPGCLAVGKSAKFAKRLSACGIELAALLPQEEDPA